MRKNTFTEEEVINITIQHGYDGLEFKTAKWVLDSHKVEENWK